MYSRVLIDVMCYNKQYAVIFLNCCYFSFEDGSTRTTTKLIYVFITYRDRRVLWIWNHHTCFSYLFPRDSVTEMTALIQQWYNVFLQPWYVFFATLYYSVITIFFEWKSVFASGGIQYIAERFWNTNKCISMVRDNNKIIIKMKQC